MNEKEAGNCHCAQCDQIGRFFELLGNKISYKSSPKILVTFGLFKIMQLSCKMICATFWALLGKSGNFLLHHLVTLIVLQSTNL